MDFELSDEQRLLTDSARAFAARELAPHAADWDREHHFPVEVIRRAAEQGLAKAEYACGYFSEMGVGTRKDPAEAKG